MNLVNEFNFIGYMPDKPELKQTTAGTAVVKCSFPTQSTAKDDAGKYKTDWHRITAYGETADNMARLLRKGDLVKITGSVKEDRWQDERGYTKYSSKFIVDTFRILRRSERPQETETATVTFSDNWEDNLPF